MLTIICQGLGYYEKRKYVLTYLKCKQFDIYCLQDTHFTYDLEPYIVVWWHILTRLCDVSSAVV